MTASNRKLGSDLAKVDAYENTPADYDELPELTDALLERVERLGLVRYPAPASKPATRRAQRAAR